LKYFILYNSIRGLYKLGLRQLELIDERSGVNTEKLYLSTVLSRNKEIRNIVNCKPRIMRVESIKRYIIFKEYKIMVSYFLQISLQNDNMLLD